MRPSPYSAAIAIAAAMLSTVAARAGAAQRSDESAAARARGVRLTYSLDYDEAREAYREAIAADPTDPAAYRQLAAVNWLNMLFRSGAVMVDDYVGEVKQNVKRTPPPADLERGFRDAIGRALALAEQRLRERPHDADAHFQLGATLGFAASYTATVEGRVLGGFRSARRAYDEHERALALDPGRKDAGLIVGLYRYAVSNLPVYWRLLAHLAGFGGGRDRGLRMVEEAAAYPADARPEAQFVLIVIYTREARYDAALRVVDQLQREYPRNRLLWLEGGSTALRAGRAAESRRQLEIGLMKLAADPRPRAFGEDARWRLTYGAALAALDETGAARRELKAALAVPANDWVHGRVHNELGRVADRTGDRAAALDEYRLALRLCTADDDGACAEEAKDGLASARRKEAAHALRP
jgi:tetratricopeptide (TPR) repeat protein